eukprot:363911-Chlamydomonas_euryale.AAC.7
MKTTSSSVGTRKVWAGAWCQRGRHAVQLRLPRALCLRCMPGAPPASYLRPKPCLPTSTHSAASHLNSKPRLLPQLKAPPPHHPYPRLPTSNLSPPPTSTQISATLWSYRTPSCCALCF